MIGLLHRVSFPQHKLPGRDCPACGADGLRAFYAVSDEQTGGITLALCETCGFVTNAAFDADQPANVEALDRATTSADLVLAKAWADRYALQGKTVVEIGCGQGEFLEALCRAAGARGIGFDPAVRRERDDSGNVLFVAGDYADFAAEVRADFVFCRNGLVGVAKPLEYLTRVREPLVDTPVVFETSDLSPTLRDGTFWDVGPDQASHFTIGSLARVFQRAGFEPTRTLVDDARRTITLEAEPTGGQKRDMPTLSELRLTSQFTRVCATRMRDWLGFAEKAAESGRRCVLWGDSERAARFVGPLGIADTFAACVDPIVDRHGRFVTGTRIKIEPPTVIAFLRPAIVVATHRADLETVRSALAAAGVTADVLCLEANVAESRDH